MSNGAPNVWTQMNYVPPRGACNHKASYLSSTCACLRFMLHPLKSSSSYECDGCGHHASFHNMENKSDDEIRKRWEQEAKERARREEEAQQRPKKRVREIEYNGGADAAEQNGDGYAWTSTARGVEVAQENVGTTTRGSTRKKAGRAIGRRLLKGRTALEDENVVVELD